MRVCVFICVCVYVYAGIQNYDTFLALNFTMADVHVIPDDRLDKVPQGTTSPPGDDDDAPTYTDVLACMRACIYIHVYVCMYVYVCIHLCKRECMHV
jgi:hypothetical protein